MMDMGYNRKLILEDGEEYYGFAFGYTGDNAIIQPVGCIFNPLRPISGIICHIHRVVEAVGKHIVT